jgi:hypothetical protein
MSLQMPGAVCQPFIQRRLTHEDYCAFTNRGITGLPVVCPEYAPDADIKFVGKVKGFDTGRDGVTSRDFIKTSGDCNLPADG